MNNRYLLSLDSSSSSCKTLVLDLEGNVAAYYSLPLSNFSDYPEILEHDAEEIWEKQLVSIERALEKVGECEIVGLAITNQRETIVTWDSKTKKPLWRAISWQDTRNKEFLEEFRDSEEMIKLKTGLRFSSYFSVSKISWILENVDCSKERLRIGTIDSWLIANFTNHEVFATDITNASRTMLMNLETGDWDGGLLEMFRIPRNILPTIYPSAHLYGHWEYKGRRIPIYGVMGDQQASLFCGASRPNMAKGTYGTGLFLMMNTGTKAENLDNAVTTVAWKIGNEPIQYALECGSYIGGNYIKELKEKGLFDSYSIENGEYEELVYSRLGGREIFMFDDVGYSDFLVGLEEGDRGEVVLKGSLNLMALLMNEMIEVLRRRFRVEEIIVGGNLSNIEYLINVQSSLSSIDLRRLDHENNSAMGVGLMVLKYLGYIEESNLNNLISKKLISLEKKPKNQLISNLIERIKKFKTSL